MTCIPAHRLTRAAGIRWTVGEPVRALCAASRLVRRAATRTYVPARFGMSSIRRLRGVDETHFRPVQFLHESPDDRQLGLAQEAICHRRILVAPADPIHADLLGAAQDQR